MNIKTLILLLIFIAYLFLINKRNKIDESFIFNIYSKLNNNNKSNNSNKLVKKNDLNSIKIININKSLYNKNKSNSSSNINKNTSHINNNNYTNTGTNYRNISNNYTSNNYINNNIASNHRNISTNNINNNNNNINNYRIQNRLCSYIITLPKRRDNVNNVILPNLNFKTKTRIFNAILKKNINKEELIQNNKLNYRTKLNEGQIACHLSHLAVMEVFLKTNYKYCLIFEDDLKKPKKIDYETYINSILNYVDKDTDLIYLGSCYNSCNRDEQTSFKGLKRCFRPLCRHAYIISREGASKILDNYNTIPQLNAGDVTIGAMILNNQLKSYCSFPPIFFQNREELGTNLGNVNPIQYCSSKIF